MPSRFFFVPRFSSHPSAYETSVAVFLVRAAGARFVEAFEVLLLVRAATSTSRNPVFDLTTVEISQENRPPEPDLGPVDVFRKDPPNLGKNGWSRRPGAQPHAGAYLAAESIGVVALVEHGVSKGTRQGVHRDAGQGIGRNRTLEIQEPDRAHAGGHVVVVPAKCRILEYEGLCKSAPQHRDFSLETHRSASQPPKVNEHATFLPIAGAFQPGETPVKTDGSNRGEAKVRHRLLCATVQWKRDEQGINNGEPGQLAASHVSEEHSLDTRGT